MVLIITLSEESERLSKRYKEGVFNSMHYYGMKSFQTPLNFSNMVHRNLIADVMLIVNHVSIATNIYRLNLLSPKLICLRGFKTIYQPIIYSYN